VTVRRLNLGAAASLVMPERATPIRLMGVFAPDAAVAAGSLIVAVKDGAGNVAFTAECATNVPGGLQFAVAYPDQVPGGFLPPDLVVNPEDTVEITASGGWTPSGPVIVTYEEADE